MIKTRGSFLVCLECCSDKNWYVLLITDGACHYMKKKQSKLVGYEASYKGGPKDTQACPRGTFKRAKGHLQKGPKVAKGQKLILFCN